MLGALPWDTPSINPFGLPKGHTWVQRLQGGGKALFHGLYAQHPLKAPPAPVLPLGALAGVTCHFIGVPFLSAAGGSLSRTHRDPIWVNPVQLDLIGANPVQPFIVSREESCRLNRSSVCEEAAAGASRLLSTVHREDPQ